MRKILILLILIPFSSRAQKDYNDLFITVWEQCPHWLEQNIKHLEKDYASQDSLEYWLNTWELFCEPNVGSIGRRLLGDLQFDGKTADSLSLDAFFQAHLDFLNGLEFRDSIFLKQWNFSRIKAEQMLKIDRWSLKDKFLLEHLAAATYHEALDLYYQKEYEGLKKPKTENSKRLSTETAFNKDEILKISVGYLHLEFNQQLEQLVNATNGIWLALDFQGSKDLVSLGLGLSFPAETAYLRILGEERVVETDLEELITFDIVYGRKIYGSRRHNWHALVGAGVAHFGTDLSYETEEGENVGIGISSYHLSFGINYLWRVYGGRQIGLRALASFTDFNQDDDLRGNLQGQSLQTTLYYRF